MTKDREAIPEFMDALNQENTKQIGFDALLKISDVRGLPVYLEALQSPNPAVREQGRKALIPLRDDLATQLQSESSKLNPQARLELQALYEGHALQQKFVVPKENQPPTAESYKHYALDEQRQFSIGAAHFFG